ncbi:MAG TPA: ATP-binding protein [Opitutaceae bacterium]|nr:ATP-binding protein [Opitutaceae bacterium]
MISDQSKNHFRVLIVDDSRNIHDDFHKVLAPPPENTIADLEAELFGDAPAVVAPRIRFTVDSAFQGEEGVAMVAAAAESQMPYALAFVDMRIPPGMDGLGTIAKLWNIDPHLQVVICSAYSDYSWSEIIARLGQNDRLVILRKPFDNIEVLQLAHALTEKWSLQQRVKSHLDDLEKLISDRTRELHESQRLFRQILENTTDLITVLDTDLRRVYSSPAHQRLLGYSAEEMSTLSLLELLHPEDIARMKAAVDHLVQTGANETIVVRNRHKEGFYLYFEANLGAVKDDAGCSVQLVITARDITERHQKEIQTRLNQKLESIGLLAAGVAHEINTPTQFISDNTRFLVDAFGQLKQIIESHEHVLKQAEAQKYLSTEVQAARAIEQECELDYLTAEIPRTLEQSLEGLGRVAKIVRSLKEFSHPGSPTRAPIDLNHAIENALMVCRHEWKYVAEAITVFDPDLPRVPCLADEFNQAILNLIINATHAIADARPSSSAPKGTITVKTQRCDDWALISVTDTGTGIPEAIRERIFEPFFTTKALGKGTGQGLPIVRSVVVGKHQGKITFVSQIGHGTTFTIHLPLTVPAADKTAAPLDSAVAR